MLKSRIEAVLFLTDKPMKAQAIARALNQDVQLVRQALLELINDYETRNGGLEVADDNGYIIQVKDEYSSLINEFAPMEMPVALLRTLSAIAIKQPVQQSEIIKIRGAGAYDHIKELMVRELIVKKDADEGRSPMLSTTKKFQEYFRLSGDGKTLRTELHKERQPKDKQADNVEAVQLQLQEPEDVAAAVNTVALEQLEEIFDASPDNSFVFSAKIVDEENSADDDADETPTPKSSADAPANG
ncbi:MAG TPA: SMC-Scp complex subunit ScpB [Planktothrix sp.]|jgi:segregation and condensation protein B